MALPNIGMSFSPFAILTAEEMNNLVENIEALAAGTGFDAGAIGSEDIATRAVGSEKLDATVGFYATTTQSIPTGTVTDITSYTEVADYGSDFASGVFTAPVKGFYSFDASVRVINLNGGRVEAILYVNGTPKSYGFSKGSSSVDDPTSSVSINIPLAANDLVKVAAFQEAGASRSLDTSYFSGYLIGEVA